MLRRILGMAACIVCVGMLLLLMPAASAGTEEGAQAEQISLSGAVTEAVSFTDWSYLYDGDLTSGRSTAAPATLTLGDSGGIGSLYLIYQMEYGAYTVTNNDTGETKTVGQGGFLHDFIDLVEMFGAAPSSVTVSWNDSAVQLNEMYLFTAGSTPDYVQKWEMPAEGRTDLILFSTHGDDEQLFFAGLLPYYANALDYQVQVVYLTDHRNNSQTRVHEMLNGLWAVGCTTYPVFGSFQDFLYETIEQTYDTFQEQGVTREDIIAFCIEQIRRFKPLVIVAHDFAGEYGHGQHMVYADCVAAALELSGSEENDPDSAEAYGVWDVPKAYFHLYAQNQIVMDWDTPMEALNGLSPFQVTQQLGYPCHQSQQWTWFTGWIYGKETAITRADQIETYSPCLYGLYRTTVGPDVEKNDFFENLTTYAEQEQQAQATQPTEPETIPESSQASAETPTGTQTETVPAEQPTQGTTAKGKWIAACIVGISLLLIGALSLSSIRWERRQRRRQREKRQNRVR